MGPKAYSKPWLGDDLNNDGTRPEQEGQIRSGPFGASRFHMPSVPFRSRLLSAARRMGLGLTAAIWCLSGSISLADDRLDEIVVTAARMEPPASRDSYAVSTLGLEDLRTASSFRLDEVLKAVPGVNLFRRTSSLVAHPTTQGISLRGIGPNGAGRALVLLDGVPLNDPFGGWVYWSAVPTSSLASVEIIRGGGAGTWGNAALAGTIVLTSEAINGTGAFVDLTAGNKDTRSVSGDAQWDLGKAALFAGGHYFSSNGFDTLRADQRGPVDRPLGSSAAVGRAGVIVHLDEVTTATLKLGYFKEERDNGTPLAFNNTRSYDASLRIVRDSRDGSGFELTLYGTDRKFQNQFSSVSDDRTSETPALLQYDVPSRAIGATAILRHSFSQGSMLETGIDIRRLKGEDRENFFFSGGSFQRDRQVGGDQLLAGAFVEYSREPVSALTLTGGFRLDYLRNFDGSGTESEIATGTILSARKFDNHDYLVPNGRLGAVYKVSDRMTLRGAAYSGFRLPTINELYRPFRVRSDITVANADLVPERLLGIESGLRLKPADRLELEATVFANWLINGVANVLITDQPGFNAQLGVFVPTGGTLSQRRNLDRIRTVGFESSLVWKPVESWTARFDYLFTDAEVTKANDLPALEGTTPPQTARHQATASFLWTPRPALSLRLSVYGSTKQYDDGFNTRKIGGFVAADAFAGYRLTPSVELYATAENLFDTKIETGNASNGLITIGKPRLFSIGLRAAF